jgi:hypothetical protein
MFAGVDGSEGVACPGDRMSGRFDDALDLLAGENRGDVVGDERRSCPKGFSGALRAGALIGPSDPSHRLAGLADIQVGDRDDMEAVDLLGL